jgi:serine-type D-Ala-D-Ala carboxypeptidase/endopeptidase
VALDWSAFDTEFDLLLKKFAADYQVPGVVFGIVADGRLAYLKTLGLRNIASSDPVTADSVFRIASMTKMFTAVGLLQLRDRGLLRFDQPVEDIVPELKSLRYPTRDSRRIRVRDLLCHTAGFVTDDPWGDRQLDMPEDRFSAYLAGGFPFARAPGIAHEYSNLGYAILGRVITNTAGQLYADYQTEHILAPLGMTSTGFEIGDVSDDRLAIGYSHFGEQWIEQPRLAHGAFGAMGGLHTTAHDYAKFVAWLLSAWPPRDEPDDAILVRASIRELAQGDGFPMITPRTHRSDPNEADQARRYGLGVIAVADPELGACVTHSGGLPGYGSNVLLVPDRGLGLFIFANVTYPHPGAAAIVRESAVKLFRAGNFPVWYPAPLPELRTLEKALRRIYDERDIRVGQEAFAINLLLDRSAEQWDQDLAKLSSELGDFTGDATLEPASALAGVFTFPCERGRLCARVLLAPTHPGRIQKLELSALIP